MASLSVAIGTSRYPRSASQRRHHSDRRELAHSEVTGVGNIDIAAAVNRNSIWMTEARGPARAIGAPRYRRSASQYSPATTLVGRSEASTPSRNFEILHLSINGRPFTAQGTLVP